MTSRLDLLPILGALACHARPGPSGPAAVLPDPAAAISAEALLETVRVLSGPDMEGRLPGGPGYDRAVAWAVRQSICLRCWAAVSVPVRSTAA